MAKANLTPHELGYRMPAEWEPHRATWVSWPHNPRTWPGPGRFDPIPAVWQALVRELSRVEHVCIVAEGDALVQARQMVGELPRVAFYPIATNDCWMRDHGLTFLVSTPALQPAAVKWQYNAWGGKYPPFEEDNAVGLHLAEALNLKLFTPNVVLEGGAIDVNGQGTVLTTEQCLLNPNRNPGMTKPDIEEILRAHLGVTNILWLGEGIVGDDTDGHIDELARFVGPRTVVAAVEEDTSDENHAPLADNFKRLQSMSDEQGRPLNVIALPMPRPMHVNGQRLPASYANFYIANNLVIVPRYGDPSDGPAEEVLRRVFPDRRVVALDARDLAWGLGAFHCITQQEPQRLIGL